MAGTAILLYCFSSPSTDDGAAAFGLLAVAAAIGGPLLGVWIDRARGAVPLTLSLSLFAGGLGGIALCLRAGQGLLAMVLAGATGLFGPAVAGGWSALLTSTDPAWGRRLAVFDANSYSVAGLVGPLVAGVVYSVAGAPAPLIVTLVLVALGSLCALRSTPNSTAPHGAALHGEAAAARDAAASQSPHPLHDLRDGFLAIATGPRLRWATASSCVAFFGFGMFSALVPSIAATRFGSPGAAAVVLGVVAVSALGANLVLDRRGALQRPVRVLAAGTLMVGVGIAAMTLANPVVTVAAAGLIGAGDGPQLAALLQVRHEEAPSRLRTQIFTTGASLKITASGLGALASAPLMANGLGAPLGLAAATHLAAVLAARRADQVPAQREMRVLRTVRSVPRVTQTPRPRLDIASRSPTSW